MTDGEILDVYEHWLSMRISMLKQDAGRNDRFIDGHLAQAEIDLQRLWLLRRSQNND